MALIVTPLSFLLIGYSLIYILAQPVFRPLMSIYSLVSSEYAPNFNKNTKVLYDANKKNDSGEVYKSSIVQPQRGDEYGRLEIERVGIDLPLYYGDSEDILYQGPGTFAGAFLPGYDRSVMIPGHTIPFFKPLGDVVAGDTIHISTYYGEFDYVITDTKVGNFNDSSMYDLAQNEKEQLILYTCYPLDGIGFKDQRLFVYADKTGGTKLLEGGN